MEKWHYILRNDWHGIRFFPTFGGDHISDCLAVRVLMNASKLIFPDGNSFKVIAVGNCQDKLNIYVQSKSRSGICPRCHMPSKRVHSYYIRKLNDLPAFGKSSHILLRSRKFYCHTDICPLKVFAERYASHFKPYKRRTERLEIKIKNLGLLTGGKSAERICSMLSMPISDTTILRIVGKAELPQEEPVLAVGVDDWAFKKRDRYGSILVNLHTGKVVDLLPDREEATLREWLQQRPQIEVVTRDRFSNFQKAIAVGAPQALQVTDRWHLLRNLSEAIQKILIRHYSKINTTLARQPQKDTSWNPISIQPVSKQADKADALQNGIRLQRFKQLKDLQGKDYSIRAMARHLGMSRQTVKKYLDMEALPRRSHRTGNTLEQYFPFIKKRMEEEPNLFLITLWKELKAVGYPGAYTTLSEALQYYGIRIGKKAGLTRKLPGRAGASFKPSTTAILFASNPDKLSDAQRKIIDELCIASDDLLKTFMLAQSFRSMMTERLGSRMLSSWIDQSRNSGINEMVSFAKGLLTDYTAIENALSLQWSNGPSEGNVNRLKLIKRQMYGRAGFELLKKRVKFTYP
ncbi:MAG: ISL3 family transposase [Cyclobacteriaceae bacterium]